jgi:glycosyltransferase involved in cell wall biosynthesis
MSPQIPRVSVIIPTFNAEMYIRYTIDSIINQTFRRWELNIIDDGSTDRTLSMVELYAKNDPRIRVIQQSNSGVADARNRGFQESHPESEFVIFLDHDDILLPNSLDLLVQFLDSHLTYVAAYGDFMVIDGAGSPRAKEELNVDLERRDLQGWRSIKCSAHEPTTLSVIISADCILTPGQVLIRRTHITNPYLFDHRYDAYDDWMAWIELTQRGDFAFLPQTVLYYRKHGNNQSQNIKKLRQGKREILRDIIHSDQMSLRHRKLSCVVWMKTEFQDGRDKISFGCNDLLKFKPLSALKEMGRALKCYRYMLLASTLYLKISFAK